LLKKLTKLQKKRGYICKWNEEQIKDYEEYRDIVRYHTEQTYRENYYHINPNDLVRDRYAYHLDHIYPIIEGWKNKVPPKLIASKHNLQMLWWKENHGKCDRTEMTLEDFYQFLENQGIIPK
jgi:hypothetical protein